MPIKTSIDKEVVPSVLPYTLPIPSLHSSKYENQANTINFSNSPIPDNDFNIQTVCINNSQVPISIGTRLGIYTTIEPNSNTIKDNTIIIRVIYNIKGKSKKSLLSYLSSIKQLEVEELKYFMTALNSTNLDKLENITLNLDYIVNISDIKKCEDKSCYHNQTDIMISLNNTTLSPKHPYSSEYKNIGSVGVLNEFNLSKDFNLKIKYINHNPKAQPKYINLLGMIMELPPIRLHNYSGVRIKNYVNYITGGHIEVFYSSKFEAGSTDNNTLTSIKYTLEEANEFFQIYDTYQQALENKNGSYDHNRKREVVELQHQLELAKSQTVKDKIIMETEKNKQLLELNLKQFNLEKLNLDISQEKIKLEKDKQERDRKEHELRQSQNEFDRLMLKLNNDKLLIELERKQRDSDIERDKKQLESQLKLDQIRLENHYSNKSNNRKDTIDIIKFIPGLIIGIGGIFAVYTKMK